MRSPIEIELRMDGSAMHATQRVSLARITIQLLTVGFVPLILMPICDPTNAKRLILLISYDYWPDLIKEFPM